ncbi:PAS domain-containing protein [Peribacillus cavernae]|uniref:histidine kinase n=1 Tax=Peribacillus cavernae TaxID=1674310 RepID=A0A433HAX5_9BACI|nr:ATP-binding protein [Peribacillus cavernae]MDQ0220089.1 two-component system phosphate regulon sensor histidine kinase PhoR [Peribacillus cavernae]RUQ25454.1 PAS domain-containing protein [Peribacillus cavernae]
MTKFRTRLLLVLISLILIVLIAAGLLLGQLFKSYYVNIFNERVQKETVFISNYIKENGGIAVFLKDGRKAELNALIDSHFTILAADGTVLYDSNVNKKNNPESHAALLDRIGENIGSNQEGYELVDGSSDLHYYWKSIEKGDDVEGYVVLGNEMGDIKQVNRQIWWILIGCLGAALIVIIMLGSQIAARYTRPIEAATTTAIELAKGNYRARAYEERSNEAGMLNTSLNILARNLQEMEVAREMQQDRLETLIENIGSSVLLIDNKGYVTLINREYKELFQVEASNFLYRVYYEVIKHKEIIHIIEEIFITEKSIKRQLRIPLEIDRKHFEVYGAPIIGNHDEWKGILVVFHDITELKKLEQMRKDFVANVSHELKTPITSIKGFSETLLDGAMKDEEALQNFLSIILKESDRLQALIQELLDLSKIEQQEFVLNLETLNLCQLLEETCAILQGKADEKNISLTLYAPDHPMQVKGDSYRVKQIFINLITNALNYTVKGGTVDIRITGEKQFVKVAVQDSGIGIEKAELPRIFERFYRVDKARSRNSGGTGLGLAIVKHIVEAHKGKITVNSEPGKGTTFTVFFNRK